jgi:hypothetical protein
MHSIIHSGGLLDRAVGQCYWAIKSGLDSLSNFETGALKPASPEASIFDLRSYLLPFPMPYPITDFDGGGASALISLMSSYMESHMRSHDPSHDPSHVHLVVALANKSLHHERVQT